MARNPEGPASPLHGAEEKAENLREAWLMLVIHSPSELTRNPDDDEKPWCYIMKDNSLSWEYCDIPSCGM